MFSLSEKQDDNMEMEALELYYTVFLKYFSLVKNMEDSHLVISNTIFPLLPSQECFYYKVGSVDTLYDFCTFYDAVIFCKDNVNECQLTIVVNIERIFPTSRISPSFEFASNLVKSYYLCENHARLYGLPFQSVQVSGNNTEENNCKQCLDIKIDNFECYLSKIFYHNSILSFVAFFNILELFENNHGSTGMPSCVYIYLPGEEVLLKNLDLEEIGEIVFFNYSNDDVQEKNSFSHKYYSCKFLKDSNEHQYFFLLPLKEIAIFESLIKDKLECMNVFKALKLLVGPSSEIKFLREVVTASENSNNLSSHFLPMDKKKSCLSNFSEKQYIIINFTNSNRLFTLYTDGYVYQPISEESMKNILASSSVFRYYKPLFLELEISIKEISFFILNLLSVSITRITFVATYSLTVTRNDKFGMRSINILNSISDSYEIFELIKNKNTNFWEFYKILEKILLINDWKYNLLPKENNLTLLHAIVIHNRINLLPSLFFLGCWKYLLKLKVESQDINKEFAGKTAEGICLFLKYKKMLKEIDFYSAWEKSLNLVHLSARKRNLKEIKKFMEYSHELIWELDSMGCSSLYWAIAGGSHEVIQYCLSLDLHLKLTDPKNSLITIACWLGHYHLVEYFATLKVDLSGKDFLKKSPIMRIAENGDCVFLDVLHRLGVIDRHQLDSLLPLAAYYGKVAFLDRLVNVYSISPQATDEFGKSAVLRAAEQGQLQMLDYLLKIKVDATQVDIRKRNVFHAICENSELKVLEYLHDNLIVLLKEDVVLQMLNSRDRYVGSELCMLIRGKDKGQDSWHYVEVSRTLMKSFISETKKGGAINISKFGELLSSGWGIDPSEDSSNEIEKRFEMRKRAASDADQTPLHIAVYKEKIEIVKFLLEKKVDLNIRDKFGSTPLHIAAMRGSLYICQLLVDHGALVNALDKLVKTPHEVAKQNSNFDVADYLNGNSILSIAEKFKKILEEKVQKSLDSNHLKELISQRVDIRVHLVNTLRELNMEINSTLANIGSGPIQEASD